MKKMAINKTKINNEEFIDINQQVNFLKEQGYQIKNKKKMKKVITNYGYFRLFHNYLNHWTNEKNILKYDLKEKDLLSAYYFDSNFSTILYQYLGYFEHKLRSNVIAQGNIECPDLNKQLSFFFPNKKYQKEIKLSLNKHIYQGAKYLVPFKELDIYPFFIIINFFDLGSTLNVMNNFKEKNIILNNFNINDEKKFYFICNNILRPFRNATAHFDIIYSFHIDLFPNEQLLMNNILNEIINSQEYYNLLVNNNIHYKNNTFIIVMLLCYLLGKRQGLYLIKTLKNLFLEEWDNKITNFDFYNNFLTNKEIMNWPKEWEKILINVIKTK